MMQVGCLRLRLSVANTHFSKGANSKISTSPSWHSLSHNGQYILVITFLNCPVFV